MRKLTALILTTLFVLSLVACTHQDDLQQGNNKKQYFFAAKVLEIYEDYLVLEVFDTGNSSISKGVTVEVLTDVVAASGCPEFKIDEYARVVMAGDIADNSSDRLEALSIYKTDKTGMNIAN